MGRGKSAPERTVRPGRCAEAGQGSLPGEADQEAERGTEGPVGFAMTVIPGHLMVGPEMTLELIRAGVTNSSTVEAFRAHVFLNTMRVAQNMPEGQGQGPGSPAFIFWLKK